MAGPDSSWPSEDEDFDAVHDGKAVSGDVTTDNAPKKVAVTATEEVPAESEAAPEPEAEQSSEEEAPEPEAETEAEEKPEADVVPEHEVPAAVQAPKDKRSAGSLLPVAAVVLAVALIGLAVYAFMLKSDNDKLEKQVSGLKQEVSVLQNNPQLLIQKQTKELIATVGKLIDLPQGEEPTIADVADPEAARKQSAFFTNAEKGDKVLMYVKAGQAILYRPSTNKIILVAPLTFNNNTAR